MGERFSAHYKIQINLFKLGHINLGKHLLNQPNQPLT
ncbi:MAG: hypothetical protein JWQ63_4016 [Mucilaginibacter sp.]|nr:hypothetical protein [Mucilaginibacter sp.]